MEIDKDLYKEIKEYCILNDLKPREYIHSLLRKAFNEDRYGKAPFFKQIAVKETEKKVVEEEKVKREEYVAPKVKVKEEKQEEVKTEAEAKPKKRTINPIK